MGWIRRSINQTITRNQVYEAYLTQTDTEAPLLLTALQSPQYPCILRWVPFISLHSTTVLVWNIAVYIAIFCKPVLQLTSQQGTMQGVCTLKLTPRTALPNERQASWCRFTATLGQCNKTLTKEKKVLYFRHLVLSVLHHTAQV